MALIRTLKGKTPKIGKDCFLAETAAVIGDVVIGDNCSIWYSAVLRGDVHYIKIGNNSNVQDNATIHATYQKSPTNIGNNVTIAHGAIIHGCTLQDNVMIGMNAVILDNAVVKSNSIVAAGSVVTIAHGAIIHGCTLQDNVMIGMNAVVLDNAVVESNSIVAAGSVVTKGTIVESGSVYAGIPAKKVKDISPELLHGEVERIANSYHMYSSWYKE